MTDRIRALLDDAVSGLEPASPDPVAAVVGRGRAGRRRSVAAGVAVFALLAGGLTAGGLVMHDRSTGSGPVVADSASVQPPVPRLVGRTVVAGAMELPVPAGWRVVRNDVKASCGTLEKTILLITTNQRGCQYAPVEVLGRKIQWPAGYLVGGLVDGFARSPVSITLAGGEPGWLLTATDDPELSPDREPGYSYTNTLDLPWSQVELFLRGNGPAEQKIIDSIRTTPGGAGPLDVPPAAAVAVTRLTVPDAKGNFPKSGHVETTDPATAAAVLRLLNDQTDVVPDAQACAGASQHGARLELGSSLIEPSPPDVARTTSVIITLGEKCQEAVSSDGGRVRISDATLAELKRLYGIGAR